MGVRNVGELQHVEDSLDGSALGIVSEDLVTARCEQDLSGTSAERGDILLLDELVDYRPGEARLQVDGAAHRPRGAAPCEDGVLAGLVPEIHGGAQGTIEIREVADAARQQPRRLHPPELLVADGEGHDRLMGAGEAVQLEQPVQGPAHEHRRQAGHETGGGWWHSPGAGTPPACCWTTRGAHLTGSFPNPAFEEPDHLVLAGGLVETEPGARELEGCPRRQPEVEPHADARRRRRRPYSCSRFAWREGGMLSGRDVADVVL